MPTDKLGVRLMSVLERYKERCSPDELADLARDSIGVESGGPPYEGWSEVSWQAAEVADLTGRVARVLRRAAVSAAIALAVPLTWLAEHGSVPPEG